MSAGKEWVRLTKPAAGKSTVTVTLQLDNVTVKFAAYSYGNLSKALAEAREGAKAALSEMTTLLAEDAG